MAKKWWKTNASGSYDRYTEFAYDQVARLIKKTYSWNSSQVLYKYDTASNVQKAYYTHQGDESYTVNMDYTYTARNFLDTYTQSVTGRTPCTVDYDTSAAGVVTSILYPNTGTRIDYERDLMGRLTKVKEGSAYYLGSATTAGITYRDTGFIEKMEYGNGIVQQFTPDTRNRIDTLKLYHKNMPSVYLVNLDYTLDGEGNVTDIADLVLETMDEFSYDAQNRLHTAAVFVDEQTAINETYNLDVMGNRISVVDGSGTKNYTTVDRNLLTQAGNTQYSYDSVGNTITKSGGYTYQYDEENRLRKVLLNGVTVASYWYDANGNRVRSVEDGQTVYYTYNGLNVIQEDNVTTGNRTDYIFAGAIRVAKKTGGVVRYYHADHLGSARVLTDEIGTKVAEYTYKPFGTTLSGAEPDYSYTGKHRDLGTGLYYFGARYYDPEIGRFTTADPARDGMNWYEYCGSNPLCRLDPNGRYTGYAHAFMTRMAADSVGITNAQQVNSMVRQNVATDYRDESNKFGYDSGRHYGQSRDEWKAKELDNAVALWKQGKQNEAMEHLGSGLHSIQDKYAHSGYLGLADNFSVMHNVAKFFGDDLDDPESNLNKFYQAYVESCQYLQSFCDQAGIDEKIDIMSFEEFCEEWQTYKAENGIGDTANSNISVYGYADPYDPYYT